MIPYLTLCQNLTGMMGNYKGRFCGLWQQKQLPREKATGKNGVIGGGPGIIPDKEVERISKKLKHMKSLFTVEWDNTERFQKENGGT